ncbi:unnamed protein product [Phytophthora lilii]|uniref:Unnamed protein product n=1 Tax=Phytophthora lilii TaxID=2077276 RepID=A0A9W6X3R5_9STRA|nr:unnamed protein product [Phytophthora lilii]
MGKQTLSLSPPLSQMSSVAVTAQFLLYCADEASLEKLQSPMLLGPLDQRSLLAIPLSVIFVYRKSSTATEELIPIDRLKRALNYLLNYYPHLTGRIVIDPKDHSPQIDQLGAGAKLVSAECSEPLKAFEVVDEDDQPGSSPRLIGTSLPDGGNALVPPFDPTEEGAASDSILTVQHTRFACGGVSIGIRLRHIICDAAGFFQLARDMAELYRGLRDVEQGKAEKVKLSGPPPQIRSYLSGLRFSSEERKRVLETEPTVFELASPVQAAVDVESTELGSQSPICGRILRFSSDELAAIKAEANAGTDAHSVSTFCALTAHIWQSIYRARVKLCTAQGMTASKAALCVPRQFLASLDMRSRNQLGVSTRYFPNCVLCPVFSLPASELLNGPLSNIAESVRNGVQPLEPTEVQQNIRWLAAQPDKQRVRLRYRYEEGGIMVSQWNKFGMYRGTELDVSPALVAQPFTSISLIDGLIYYLATEDQLSHPEISTETSKGGIDASLALSEPVWEILRHDTGFRRHRGW